MEIKSHVPDIKPEPAHVEKAPDQGPSSSAMDERAAAAVKAQAGGGIKAMMPRNNPPLHGVIAWTMHDRTDPYIPDITQSLQICATVGNAGLQNGFSLTVPSPNKGRSFYTSMEKLDTKIMNKLLDISEPRTQLKFEEVQAFIALLASSEVIKAETTPAITLLPLRGARVNRYPKGDPAIMQDEKFTELLEAEKDKFANARIIRHTEPSAKDEDKQDTSPDLRSIYKIAPKSKGQLNPTCWLAWRNENAIVYNPYVEQRIKEAITIILADLTDDKNLKYLETRAKIFQSLLNATSTIQDNVQREELQFLLALRQIRVYTTIAKLHQGLKPDDIKPIVDPDAVGGYKRPEGQTTAQLAIDHMNTRWAIHMMKEMVPTLLRSMSVSFKYIEQTKEKETEKTKTMRITNDRIKCLDLLVKALRDPITAHAIHRNYEFSSRFSFWFVKMEPYTWKTLYLDANQMNSEGEFPVSKKNPDSGPMQDLEKRTSSGLRKMAIDFPAEWQTLKERLTASLLIKDFTNGVYETKDLELIMPIGVASDPELWPEIFSQEDPSSAGRMFNIQLLELMPNINAEQLAKVYYDIYDWLGQDVAPRWYHPKALTDEQKTVLEGMDVIIPYNSSFANAMEMTHITCAQCIVLKNEGDGLLLGPALVPGRALIGFSRAETTELSRVTAPYDM